MSLESIAVARPQRWDHPLDDSMTNEQVDWLLKQAPFSQLDAGKFARHASLREILRNDTRLHSLCAGDVIFQKGQYGGSAYLVIGGSVRIFLTDALAAESNRLSTGGSRGWRSFDSFDWMAWFTRSRHAKNENSQERPKLGLRGEGNQSRLFLQDVPGVLDAFDTTEAVVGDLFGELAAVTRAAREFTAIAAGDCVVLEIRWQGLKLLKQSPEFRSLLDQRYRTGVLKDHLRETEIFRGIPESSLDTIVESARLESFGDLEWYADYREHSAQSPTERIRHEPLIAEEGMYAVGLWIIRGGFARLSRRQGAGHRTLAYLGKGQVYGLRELAHNWRESSDQTALPFQESLRAIGYVDAICVPRVSVVKHILPFLSNMDLPARIANPRYRFGQPVLDAETDSSTYSLATGLLEFLVDQRLMNGRQAMIIDTQRCTRCDDCVRACGATHDNVPLFERRGAQYGQWLFAQACMHCEDPVCMIGCPTGAIHREESSGQVQINESTCIGCKSCAESCPYDNIRMQPKKDKKGRKQVDQKSGLPILQATKCDLCHDSGGKPACQSACPHDALVRIDMSDLKGVSRWLQSKAV